MNRKSIKEWEQKLIRKLLGYVPIEELNDVLGETGEKLASLNAKNQYLKREIASLKDTEVKNIKALISLIKTIAMVKNAYINKSASLYVLSTPIDGELLIDIAKDLDSPEYRVFLSSILDNIGEEITEFLGRSDYSWIRGW